MTSFGLDRSMTSFRLEEPAPPAHPLVGRRVVDLAGRLIGTVAEVYLDHPTGEEEWIAVQLSESQAPGCFGLGDGELRFVPFEGLEVEGDRIRCRWGATEVATSPVEVRDEALSRVEEDQLYAHYGLDYPTEWVNAGAPGGGVVVGVAGLAAASDRVGATTRY